MTCPRDERIYTVRVSTGGTTWETQTVRAKSRTSALTFAAARPGNAWTVHDPTTERSPE